MEQDAHHKHHEKLYLKQAQIGPMANFVYLIGDPKTHKAAAVDPAWDVDAIIDFARREGYEIDKILITHYHPDHLGGHMMGQSIEGAAQMLERIKAKVYVNKREAEGVKTIAGLSDSDLVKVDAGDTIKIGEHELKFLHTPGHTPGSQCFLVDGNLISGDTLFVGSCGRVDLPGSNPEDMYYSLNKTLRNLDDATVVYPGHAYSSESSTTIGDQKCRNLYMRFDSLDEFLEAMGYSSR
ncbi:MAG TPA: MBL fold metallo-hydrolase [Candidatus Binataceae bacterium]|nr:MBL fold metallo-hydrolase [Candidatus Binataceae bacterium]